MSFSFPAISLSTYSFHNGLFSDLIIRSVIPDLFVEDNTQVSNKARENGAVLISQFGQKFAVCVKESEEARGGKPWRWAGGGVCAGRPGAAVETPQPPN